jgi:hypothetical protein
MSTRLTFNNCSIKSANQRKFQAATIFIHNDSKINWKVALPSLFKALKPNIYSPLIEEYKPTSINNFFSKSTACYLTDFSLKCIKKIIINRFQFFKAAAKLFFNNKIQTRGNNEINT